MFVCTLQGLTAWPSMTSDKLWPLSKNKKVHQLTITHSCQVKKLSMLPNLDIAFMRFSIIDLWGPQTSSDLHQKQWNSFKMIKSYTECENYPPFLHWDIFFSRYLVLTAVNLSWPLTSTKNNKVLPLMINPYTSINQVWKVSIIPTFI